jgi:hypothetical protein
MTAIADIAGLTIDDAVAIHMIDSPPVKTLSQRGGNENL